MHDYYYLLGIPQSASDGEIKTAYRKLSKKFHPDVNQSDEYFVQRFKDIQGAYETLGSSSSRSQYDRQFDQYYSYRSAEIGKYINYYFEHEKEISEKRRLEKEEKKVLETNLRRIKNRIWYQSFILIYIIVILTIFLIASYVK